MPVNGLPLILDTTLNQILQESEVYSFKFFHNPDQTSSVVMRFADIGNHLARSHPTYPPRPSLQRRFTPDHEKPFQVRNQNKHSDVCSKPVFSPSNRYSSTPSSPMRSSNKMYRSLDTPVRPRPNHPSPQSPEREIKTNTPPQNFRPDDTLPPSPTTSVPNYVNLPGTDNNDHSVITSRHHQAKTIRSSSFFYGIIPATKTDINESGKGLSIIENKEESGFMENDVFHSENDLEKAEEWREALSEEMEDSIFDLRRNRSIARVALRQCEGDESVLAIETNDLVFDFHPSSRTVGYLHVFEEWDADKMEEKDKVPYQKFLALEEQDLDTLDPQLKEDIIKAISNVMNFLRNIDSL